MTSVLIYDEHAGWSPSLNASKGTGGTEVHLVQIANWLAATGVYVEAWCHGGRGSEQMVSYVESRDPELRPSSCFDIAITVRRSRIPASLGDQTKVVTLVTDDPRPCPDDFAHLLGRSTLVCVSEWQAGLYRALGHECVVIPAVLDDSVYASASTPKEKHRLCCLSGWSKGTEATLAAWRWLGMRMPSWRLMVGSPYGAPGDAEQRCAEAGATWLGELRPYEIVDEMAQSEAHVRICTIGETFGATDAIARAVGCRVNVLCTGDVGALEETGAGPYTRHDWWERDVFWGRDSKHVVRDFRVSTVMPQWAALLGVT